MAKCPVCGKELTVVGQQKFYCNNCNKYFAVKQPKTPPQQHVEQKPQVQQTQQQVQTQVEQQSTQQNNDELSALKARIAALEKEQQVRNVAKNKISKEAILASPAWAWLKKYAKIILPSLLGLIAIITLMVCFIGIRGIYVNVEDPNDFYSFTATQYKGYGEDFGQPYVEDGTWKTSGGKIVFTINDEDFGKFSADYVYSTKNGYNTLFIGENKDSLKEYKRVSIIKYDINAKKVNVKFDLNGGNGHVPSQKIKLGEKAAEPDTPTRMNREFRGWYTDPYGYKNGGIRFNEDARIWENVTYYANWYNPTDYTITINGEAHGTLSAKEGESLLKILNTYENKGYTNGYTCDYYIDGTLIDEKTYMPESNIFIEAKNPRGKQYTAYFNANGGTFKINSEQFIYGKDYVLPLIVPTIDNGDKAFIGWMFNDVTYYSSQTITPPHNDMYFIAIWGDKITYSLNEDGNGYIVKSFNDKYTTTFDIPSYYNNLPVVGIESGGISSDNLIHLSIPDSIMSIDGVWFCPKLETITIAQNNPIYHSKNNCIIEKTSKKLIKGCNDSTIPDDGSVIIIGDYAFSTCYGLKSITIPNGVVTIGNYAFLDCKNLKNVTIGKDVAAIGQDAFWLCESLEAVYIKDIVKWCEISCPISGCAKPLWYAKNLYLNDGQVLDLVIPESVTCISVMAFAGCNITSLTIINGVESIDAGCFYCCENLKTVTIPTSVTSIGAGAFEYCGAITDIYYGGTKAQWKKIDKGTYWDGNTERFTIHCSDGSMDNYGFDI